MAEKILVTNDVQTDGVEELKKAGYDVDILPNMNEDEFVKVVGKYDAFITRSMTHVTKKVIDAADHLKVIGRAGVGVDSIDIPDATKRGIVVVNTPESNTLAATELTCGLIIGVSRFIPQANQSIMEGRWDRKKFVGQQLQNKTIGIIGVGRIGSRVAKRMQAMEMRTIGYDPYIPRERGDQLGVDLVDLDTLLKESDYITMHVPLTDETRGMIGKDEIAKMKDGAYVINASRGAVLDIYALADALKSGHIAGAGIDVYPKEPLTKDANPFLGMQNVVLTPHIGANTREAQRAVSVDVATGVMQALRGEPVPTAVNMAPVSKQVYAKIKPYFELAERMGTLAISLCDGAVTGVTIEYIGDLADVDTNLLSTAVLKGILNPVMQDSVNYVNAALVANNRHIAVKETKLNSDPEFVDAIRLTLDTEKGQHKVVGTLFNKGEARIAKIDGFRVDFEPKGYFLVAPHRDQPNMIGQISTILGKAGINITGMQVGRSEEKGQNIMTIAIEKDIPDEILDKVRAIDGIVDVKMVCCEPQL